MKYIFIENSFNFTSSSLNLKAIDAAQKILINFVTELNKKGHKCLKTTDWSEGFILCARKQDKIYDAYADIRSYKSQIFQAQALAW